MKKVKLESRRPSMTTFAFPAPSKERTTGAPAGVVLLMKRFAPSDDQSMLDAGQSFRLTS